jgi:hypothetical protein
VSDCMHPSSEFDEMRKTEPCRLCAAAEEFPWTEWVMTEKVVIGDAVGGPMALRAIGRKDSQWSDRLEVVSDIGATYLTRDQVRLTLIPLLERFASTGRLTSGGGK